MSPEFRALEEKAVCDPDDMLEAVLGAGQQLRESWQDLAHPVAQQTCAQLAQLPRPRSIVITGMGGSGIAGEALGSLLVDTAPLPVTSVRGYALPAWIGPQDVVIALSCSGTTEETLAAAAQARERGCVVVAVTPLGSPLAQAVTAPEDRAGIDGVRTGSFGPAGFLMPVDARGRMPRASMWTMLTPQLAVAQAFGLIRFTEAEMNEAAQALEEVAAAHRSGSVAAQELAQLAGALGSRLPVVWGSGPLGQIAVTRLAGQLAENAKLPMMIGRLPEASHNQIVSFDGVWGEQQRMQLIFVQDLVDDPRNLKRTQLIAQVAQRREIPVAYLDTAAALPLARLAQLVAQIDLLSVYTAYLLGEDPTPIAAIMDLKELLTTSVQREVVS